MPAEGGTENFRYETRNTTSELSNYLRVGTYNKPKMKFFLRAESFYNFSSEVQRLVEEDDFGGLYKAYGGNLHECSHGEAFIKLVKNRFTDHGIYILDEPTTGLHFADVHKLIDILQRLTEGGNTVVVIEHNLDVIKTADYIIDIVRRVEPEVVPSLHREHRRRLLNVRRAIPVNIWRSI